MFSLDEKIFSAKVRQSQRIQTLIIGRLLAIFLLVVAGWIWQSGKLRLSLENFPQGLFLVFLISVGLTIVYFFVLRFNKNYDWQTRVQFFLDALLITWLVWRTGDLTSPYITLYIVLISVSSLFLRARETLLMAAAAVFLFTLLSVASAASMLPSENNTLELSRVAQIVSFHAVAFLIVGLLASRLSDRQASGEQLKEATKTLANLRVLHERIIESIRSGLITTDLDGNIYTFNHAATEITGYKAEEMIGKPIAGLLGNLEKPAFEAHQTDKITEQPRFETDLITPEGFAVRVGYSISPLFSETGEESGLIVQFSGFNRHSLDGGKRPAQRPSRGCRTRRRRSRARNPQSIGRDARLDSSFAGFDSAELVASRPFRHRFARIRPPQQYHHQFFKLRPTAGHEFFGNRSVRSAARYFYIAATQPGH
jgi:PAS domain S-box-containing protein